MRRVLAIEWRRSAARGAAVILLVAGAGMLYAAPHRWAAGWMFLATTQREYLTLLFPLALAAGAWQARRDHRSGTAELLASTARPRAQRMMPALAAIGLAVAGAYLAVTASAVPWIIGTARYLPAATFAVVAVGALALVAGGWLGLAVGRLVPALVTAPALAVAAVATLMLLPFAVGDRDWLALAFSPLISWFSDFQTINGRVSAAQAVWLGALAVTGAVLVAAGNWRTRVAALLPVVLGATGAIMLIPRDEDAATPIDPVARQLVCAEGTPRVCVSRLRAGLLSEVTPLARQALTMLAKLPDVPAEADEDTGTVLPGSTPMRQAGKVLFWIGADQHGHLAWKSFIVTDIVTDGLTNPRGCDRGEDLAVTMAAVAWLTGREPRTDPRVGYDPDPAPEAVALWHGLQRLPEQEAKARVEAVHRATLNCGNLEGLLTR